MNVRVCSPGLYCSGLDVSANQLVGTLPESVNCLCAPVVEPRALL